jgi:hypothetical protein
VVQRAAVRTEGDEPGQGRIRTGRGGPGMTTTSPKFERCPSTLRTTEQASSAYSSENAVANCSRYRSEYRPFFAMSCA